LEPFFALIVLAFFPIAPPSHPLAVLAALRKRERHPLLRLAMQRVSFTNRAKLLKLDPVRVVLFILLRGIVTILAIGTGQSNSDAQPGHLLALAL
jgi:hypothetical protein